MGRTPDFISASPLDAVANNGVLEEVNSYNEANGFHDLRPSRFNVQTTTPDGWLLLWNTYTGNMNAFRPEQRTRVLDLLVQDGVQGRVAGDFGRYLEGRGYLIPEDADELGRVRYEFGKENYRTDILELILLPSEDCNFRCTYCYEDFRRGTMKPEVRSSVKKLVEGRIKNINELTVGWFGGEPLYGLKAIEDLAPFLSEICEREGVDYFSHMTTNAYLMTDEVVGNLLSWNITDYQITLDGLPEHHNEHRPRRDGAGTFDVIFQNLANMSKRPEDFSVVIRVNFDQTNVEGLDVFLKLLEAEFKDDDRFTISFHAVGRWGGDNDANLDVCGKSEAHSVKMRFKAAARALGLKVTSGWQPGAGVGSQVCYAVRPYNFIVGAHGDLMKCTIDLDKKDRNMVGKLLPDGKLDLNLDKMAKWTEPAFESDSGCQSCHMLPACQGVHCPQIRMDHDKAPCPSIRRTAKEEMADYFQAKQSSADGSGPLGRSDAPVGWISKASE